MDTRTTVFMMYALIGLLLVLFNKQVSHLNYKFILFYTEKLNIEETFFFKVDKSNKAFMLALTRTFTTTFGLVIFLLSLFYVFQ